MRQPKIYQIFAIFIFLNLIFNISTWGKEYRPEVGVRALGMAGAFTSCADDPTAALWNPAGLARLQHKSVFVYDLSQGALSFAHNIEQVGTFGLNILDLNYKDRFIYDKLHNPLGKFEIGYNQITLSYARHIGNHLMMGTNFGYNRVPWEDISWQPSFDAGMITHVKSIFVGARITDIADTKFYNHDGKPLKNFYQQVSVGASWIPSKHLSINSDFNAARRKIRIGTEVGCKGIYLRSGAIRNLNNSEMPLGWTAGASINWKGIQLNYAYLNDDGIDYKHLISVGFELGGIKQKPPRTSRPPKNEIQIPKLSPTKSHTPRSLQMKSTIKEEIKPTIAEKDDTTHTSPVKLPVIDNPPNNTFLPNANTGSRKAESEVIQQTSESEPEFNKPDNSKNNPENSETKNSETLVMKLAKKYNVELPLILAVVEIESKFKPDNISKVGAVGFMQLMPVTARELGLRVPMYKNPLKPVSNPRLDERFDPKKNLEAGMKYLSSMIKKYNKNYVLALCAYNAGPGRVDKKVPSIRETEKHVGKVLNRYYEYQNSPQEMRNALEKLNAILGE